MLILLCSDGLHGVVGHEAIRNVLADDGMDIRLKAETLIDAARNAGGPDNITVLILKV
jgi:protein phosphatase